MDKLTGRSFTLFIEAQKSQATREAYSYFIIKYLQYLKLETNNTDILLQYDSKTIQNQLIDYILYLKGMSLRTATISSYVAGVIAFYFLNDIVLNGKKIYRYVGESQLPLANRAYSREEIARILEYCDERTRAIILILCSCGCRINALTTLKIQDLVIQRNHGLYQIWLYNDSKDRYYSFLTVEATKALEIYLDARKVAGEQLTDKSYVFRKEYDKNDSTAVNNPRKLTSRAYEEAITDLLIKAGLRKVAHVGSNKGGKVRNQVKLTSGFRKFFDTIAEGSGIRPLIKEILMGHEIGLDKNYLKPTEQDVLNQYLLAADNLTINDENRLKDKVKILEKDHTRITILEKDLKELTDSHDILVQMYEADPQERRKLKALYRQAKDNGTRIPGEMLFLKKEEYTPGSFSYSSYELNIQDQERKKQCAYT